MKSSLREYIASGWRFVVFNPQILFTIITAVVIVAAFIFSSQLFLSIAVDTQERFERHRLQSIQDTFVAFAARNMAKTELLDEAIADVMRLNETLASFRVVVPVEGEEGTRFVIISSNDPSQIGIEEPDTRVYLRNLAATDPTSSFYEEVREKDGSRRFVSVRAIVEPGTQGRISGWVITEGVLSEFDALARKKINQAYAVLVAVIGIVLALILWHARLLDYAGLYRKLREVDRMKDDFISMASHELRTPLGVIRGYAEFLYDAPLGEKEKEYARRIEIAASQLDELVEGILDVSRLEQGRMQFEKKKIDIASIAREAALTFEEQAKAKGLYLKVEAKQGEEFFVEADPARMRQVFINLIGNAIKYTPQGNVTVRLFREGDRVVARVSDTGIGLSAEEQKNLFQKFYRVKSEETKDIRGTGLGLWITKQLVEKMGGTISVESIKGTGTHFVISFPALKEDDISGT